MTIGTALLGFFYVNLGFSNLIELEDFRLIPEKPVYYGFTPDEDTPIYIRSSFAPGKIQIVRTNGKSIELEAISHCPQSDLMREIEDAHLTIFHNEANASILIGITPVYTRDLSYDPDVVLKMMQLASRPRSKTKVTINPVEEDESLQQMVFLNGHPRMTTILYSNCSVDATLYLPSFYHGELLIKTKDGNFHSQRSSPLDSISDSTPATTDQVGTSQSPGTISPPFTQNPLAVIVARHTFTLGATLGIGYFFGPAGALIGGAIALITAQTFFH